MKLKINLNGLIESRNIFYKVPMISVLSNKDVTFLNRRTERNNISILWDVSNSLCCKAFLEKRLFFYFFISILLKSVLTNKSILIVYKYHYLYVVLYFYPKHYYFIYFFKISIFTTKFGPNWCFGTLTLLSYKSHNDMNW